jgi:hypothetical protein
MKIGAIIIIVLILVAVGSGIYFLLQEDEVESGGDVADNLSATDNTDTGSAPLSGMDLIEQAINDKLGN